MGYTLNEVVSDLIKYGVPVEYLDVDKMTLNVKGRTLFILLKLKDSDKQNEMYQCTFHSDSSVIRILKTHLKFL